MARGRQRRESEELGEPEILPMMNVLFMLVMVLMGMSAFLPLGVISTEAPKLGGAGPGGAPLKEELNLTVVMLKAGMNIVMRGSTGISLPTIEVDGKQVYDFAALTQSLIEIKKQYPEEIHITIAPDSNVVFNDIIHTMDASREMPDGKPMFPAVAFGAGVE